MTAVPFARPWLPGGEAEALAEVVASGWVSQGPRVEAFERAFAARVGAPHAVATTNCTTALALALHTAGVGPGDEVVVPSLSFIATANAVWHCGARPVFADVDPVTLNLDPAAAEAAVGPRTRAVMPVHQLGLPADMDAFAALGARHGVAIVQDAACAIGAEVGGIPVGGLDSPACYSLHPRKVITTGEGGMITTHDEALAERLRRLRAHGMDLSDLARHRARAVVVEQYPERGFNARMTDLQAALGLCQLEVLDEVLAERRRLAERYTAALGGVPGLTTPRTPDGVRRTWQSYAVRIEPGAAVGRDELMARLLQDGIATRRGVMAIHLEASYAGEGGELPHTEAAARELLLLPLFPGLGDDAQDAVVASLSAHLIARAA